MFPKHNMPLPLSSPPKTLSILSACQSLVHVIIQLTLMCNFYVQNTGLMHPPCSYSFFQTRCECHILCNSVFDSLKMLDTLLIIPIAVCTF